MRRTAAVAIAAIATFSCSAARAHCHVPYEITGPGGLYYEISMGAAGQTTYQFPGALPEGTINQLSGAVTLVDTRTVSLNGGTMEVTVRFTDDTGYASCPTLNVDVDNCTDHIPATSTVSPYPPCNPHFTAVQTGPKTYYCSATCDGGPQAPPLHTFVSPNPPSISSISPASAAAGAAGFALTLSGTGFFSGSEVVWNGQQLLTIVESPTSLLTFIPAEYVGSAGTANVAVFNTGGPTSASTAFTISGSSGSSAARRPGR